MNSTVQHIRSGTEIRAVSFAATPDNPLQRSQVLETPGLSYHLSQTRLLAKLLSAPNSECSIDLHRALAVPGVQQVLQQDLIAVTIRNPSRELLSELRYAAHIYNSTLGAGFVVVSHGDSVRLCNDGALRALIEQQRATARISSSEHPRQWSEYRLLKFLQELPTCNPEFERILVSARPQGSQAVVSTEVSRTQQLHVRDIVIPTANRPDDVRRLLRSLAKSFEFYGYPADSIRIRIVDTSTTPELRSAMCEAVAWAQHQGLAAEYVGPTQMRAELLKVRESLPANRRKAFSTVFLRGLFSAQGDEGISLTIGTIRNAISLVMRDTPHISLDDDMMVHVPLPSMPEYQRRWERCRARPLSYDLNAESMNDYARTDERPGRAERTDFEWLPTDIVGIVNRGFGAPDEGRDSRRVGTPMPSRFADGGHQVTVIRSYLAGATPDVTTFFKRFIQSGDKGELSGANTPYGLPIEVPAASLARGYSSGTMFAVKSGLAVPFMDARAYEDVAQSQLGHLLFNSELQHQAGVIEHRRHIGPRVVNSVQYIDVLLGFHLMNYYLSTVRPDSFVMQSNARNRVELYRELGKKLWADSQGEVIGKAELDSLVRGYQGMAASLRAAKQEGADTFLNSAEEIAIAIRQRLKVLQRANGLLYYCWPDICAAAGQM